MHTLHQCMLDVIFWHLPQLVPAIFFMSESFLTALPSTTSMWDFHARRGRLLHISGPVIEYNLAVVIMVHFKRGLECLNTLLFRVYTESSTLYIFMLYNLIHTVLAVEFFCSFVEQGLQYMYTVRLIG